MKRQDTIISDIAGMIKQIDYYLEDAHIEPEENYRIVETQRGILAQTLKQLKDTIQNSGL